MENRPAAAPVDIPAFAAAQLALLAAELQSEMAENAAAVGSHTPAALQRAGLALTNLVVEGRRTGMGGRTVLTLALDGALSVASGPSESGRGGASGSSSSKGNKDKDKDKDGDGPELPEHGLRTGDIVLVAEQPGGSAKKREMRELEKRGSRGVITRTRRSVLEVGLDYGSGGGGSSGGGEEEENVDALLSGRVWLVKLADDVTFRRMSAAMQTLQTMPASSYSSLIQVLFGLSSPFPVSEREENEEGAVQWIDPTLNDSQKRAVRFALASKEVALIHGPPGTGKTHTLIELILQMVGRGQRVLVCGPSNISVDNLVERLAPHGVPMVRLGHPARLLPSVLGHALDVLTQTSEAGAIVRDVRADMDARQGQLRRIGAGGSGSSGGSGGSKGGKMSAAERRTARRAIYSELRDLRREYRERERRCVRDIVADSRVVLTTLHGAGGSQLRGLASGDRAAGSFDVVVIDEVSQALEAQCWVPLLGAQKVVCAGDHLQLPPTVKTKKSAAAEKTTKKVGETMAEKAGGKKKVQERGAGPAGSSPSAASAAASPPAGACFPHDVEICTGRSQPHCVHHAFVLQQDSSHTLYGICLRVWSRADEKRAETIRDLRKRTESDFYDSADETYWIPYCLSFLSRYPLYNLLGDYLRGMWIHWNKATNLFHAEEVSRILSFPAPRLNDLVRIDMKDYALCYQFPSSPTGFQNFAMWPLFCCLSIPNIVGVIEAAVSPTRRIIFVSHYPAMLTMAAESVRFCVRVYEWSGLYVPVVHARHAKELVEEPGPYILGITAECRSLFTAPSDALVVDLDRNFVLTSSPPTALTPGQRNKFVSRLTESLNGDVTPSGVPQHLRSAYGGGKLVPAGQIIVMRGEVESIQDPEWWNQDAIMAVMDHVCEKMGRNSGIKAVFGGSVKKPLMTKVSMRHLNEIVRERNQYSRDALEAWQDFINLKGRMDTELAKVTKRNNYLVEELESWKQQFLKFQAFAETLTKETQDLKVKIENHKRENRRLGGLIDQQKDDNARLTVRLTGTEKQRDDALEALVLQQEIAEELERERQRNTKELSALQHTNVTLARQRDEARRVVLHLRSLIGGQTHHMEHLVESLTKPDDILEELEGAYEEDLEGTPEEVEERLKTMHSKRMSSSSFKDVADRHLKDKTDAIAHIIRNIAEQCQAAVEGLQMAQDAVLTEDRRRSLANNRRNSNLSVAPSDDGHSVATSEIGDDSLLQPSGRSSSIPPTPDLIPNRASTSMSIASTATTPERSSQQYTIGHDIPTKIVEDEDEYGNRSDMEAMPQEVGVVGKHSENLIHRSSGARISALGGSR